MKWLLYIFLLANLATFFWHYQPGLFRADADKPAQKSVDGELVPQLVLLREYESKPEETQSSSNVVSDESCFNLGPFNKRKKALLINQELKTLGISANLQVNKDKKRPGYWVLILPKKNRKAARDVIAQLKQKKIKDYFLVATGSQKNAISLGVFSQSGLAKKRLKMIKKLGFTVSIEKVKLPKREYWLEWPTAAEAVVEPERLGRWLKRFPGIGNTKKACQEKT